MRRFVAIMLSLMLVLLASGTAMAQTKAQKNKKAALAKEIAILDKQIKETNKQSKNALSSLNLTRKKITARKELVAESDKEIAELDSQIQAQSDTLRKLEEKFSNMSVYYKDLVKTAYRSRDARTWYMYILSSGNFGQGLRRYAYLKRLSSQMNSQAKQIREMRDTIAAHKQMVESLRSEAGAVRQERMGELDQLQKEEGESAALVAQLKKDKATYQKQLKSKQKQMEDLNKEIQRMIAEAQRAAAEAARKEAARKAAEEKKAAEAAAKKNANKPAATTTTPKTTTPSKPSTTASSKPVAPADVKLDAEFAKNKGKLPWPAEGSVVESYGQHYHPVYTNVKMPFNNGVNIAVSPNTAVKAVFDGTVKQVIIMPGYNQCVLVQHGGYFTFYCKLANVNVKAGDKVKTGQVLGKVDTISGETQLHFELWEGKSSRNPEIWLR